MNTQNDIEERSKATASHDDYAAANTNEREYRTQESPMFVRTWCLIEVALLI